MKYDWRIVEAQLSKIYQSRNTTSNNPRFLIIYGMGHLNDFRDLIITFDKSWYLDYATGIIKVNLLLNIYGKYLNWNIILDYTRFLDNT